MRCSTAWNSTASTGTARCFIKVSVVRPTNIPWSSCSSRGCSMLVIALAATFGSWAAVIAAAVDSARQAGAAEALLNRLEQRGRRWDGRVLYQSERCERYDRTLEQRLQLGLRYACECTRRGRRVMGGINSGRCRHRAASGITSIGQPLL